MIEIVRSTTQARHQAYMHACMQVTEWKHAETKKSQTLSICQSQPTSNPHPQLPKTHTSPSHPLTLFLPPSSPAPPLPLPSPPTRFLPKYASIPRPASAARYAFNAGAHTSASPLCHASSVTTYARKRDLASVTLALRAGAFWRLLGWLVSSFGKERVGAVGGFRRGRGCSQGLDF
jgi:hypothetical protein